MFGNAKILVSSIRHGGGIDGLQEYMKINNSLNLFPAGAAKRDRHFC